MLMIVILMIMVLMVMVAVLTMHVLLMHFLLYLFSHKSKINQKYQNSQLIHRYSMTSQQQYYQAKVFLNAYRDALSTLDQIAANRATLQKYKAYEQYLVSSSLKGEIHVEGNNVRPGTYFNESKIRKLGQFSKSLFSSKFSNLDSIHNYGDLAKALQSYL